MLCHADVIRYKYFYRELWGFSKSALLLAETEAPRFSRVQLNMM
jgi:hypothetical protein